MGLLLDPTQAVEHVIEDVTFEIRVLSSREYVKVMKHLAPLKPLLDAGTVDLENAEAFENFGEILTLGVRIKGATEPPWEQIDRIPFRVWGYLLGKILEVNASVTEEEAKN